MSARVLEFQSVSKSYGGLRPLRIERLEIDAGSHVALVGMDGPAAEVFVNLATGAALPDKGTVSLFDRSTATIEDADEWLAIIDHVGIVSERAVLLQALSVVQNLAIPFSLDIEPPPPGVQQRVAQLAREVGLSESAWQLPLGEMDAASRLRVRLGRALALDPALVLFEHPTARIPEDEIVSTGRSVRAVLERRGTASIILTADLRFANAAASTVWQLEPSTGRLQSPPRSWFRRS